MPTLNDHYVRLVAKLGATVSHIVKRGSNDSGPEMNFFINCINEMATSITLDSGHVIKKVKGEWTLFLPDGKPYMNTWDHKTPYTFGRIDNAFYLDPLKVRVDDAGIDEIEMPSIVSVQKLTSAQDLRAAEGLVEEITAQLREDLGIK